MPRPFTPKIVTANDLLEGDVIYLSGDTWVRDLSRAEIITEEAEAQRRLAQASAQTGRAVGVYLADVRTGANGLETTHFREAFRATGPSNYAHGKQAERDHV